MPEPARRVKVAVACQGGGSQTAFTAGALKALIERVGAREFELVSISGTSGGAVCATLLWYAYERGEHPVWQRMLDFWKENTAQGWVEDAINGFITNSMRMVHRGLLPAFQVSPSSPMFRTMLSLAGAGTRPEFTDFAALLRKYIDFDEVASWGPRQQRPILMIGAANISDGRMVKFVSNKEPIRLEHILASCAVPSIFPAVRIDGQGYWDGLFSDNPPVEELIRPRSVGLKNIPEEIWLIKINPTMRATIPENPDDIIDRRNQLEGNISLFQQLQHLEFVNDLLIWDAFRPDFLAYTDIKAPIRIPKSFAADTDKPYHIPCIEMPEEVQEKLDYEGKIDRSARNIDWLIAQGAVAVDRFLEARAKIIANPPPVPPRPTFQT
jgi:NTE family protein